LYFKFFKYFSLFLIVLFSCDDIERDNILDPKNPSSARPQIITVEAFVNTNDSIPNPFNDFLLIALDQLEDKYSDKLTIAEYHRSILPKYSDDLAINANEILYNTYFQGINSGIKGVPDVYINGIAARVQGASSIASVLFRLEEALNPFLSQNSYFTIEPSITDDGSNFKISTKLAKLGSTDKENLLIKAIITSVFDDFLHQRVVKEIFRSQKIDKISNGETIEVTLGEYPMEKMKLKVVFIITSEDELEVYQSIEVDLN
jgi:hypothetical protein